MIYFLVSATKIAALCTLLFFACGLIVSCKTNSKTPLARLFTALSGVMFNVAYALLTWIGIYFVFTCNSVQGLV